ncbi:neuropeptide CCHamide-1 receptor-like isoform X2 [Varroa jacobsoni]|uniref:neuropeptide CCHamide-1 receptor-like isoform X2 n=1 Tax=Varroa jacobsoni TaxID=62625 RepID=UPI000BFA5ECB|nr:neuropeptide CCHamide-1 receptor-like isoform X2 [Varroa jacobsoni]
MREELSYIPLGKHLETYLAPPVFTLIFGVGLIGNGTLMLIFLRNKAMRSVPNIYIMSLSLGDLFVITGTVPFICAIYVLDSWPFGLFLCKLSEFMRDLSIGVTVLTLTMLSIDRYIAIALPLYKRKGGRHDRRVTIVITCLVWFIASLMAIPGAYFSYLGEAHLPGRPPIVYCHPFPQHMQPWYPRLMVMMKFLVQYVIPLIVIATFYILMSRSLIKTAKSTLCDQKNAAAKKQQKARVKVAKISLCFVLIFAVCFFPNHVVMIWLYFHPNAHQNYNDFWHLFKLFGFVLTFVNSCLNPIALYFVSGVFRSYFKAYICCQPRTRTVVNNSMLSYRQSLHPSVQIDSTSLRASLISRHSGHGVYDHRKNSTRI